MAEYNGHRSWNAWNVALYMSSDEFLYREAVDAIRKTRTVSGATNRFLITTGLLGDKTPDGATYNRTSVREAIAGLKEGL
jgi:hypothetical protein